MISFETSNSIKFSREENYTNIYTLDSNLSYSNEGSYAPSQLGKVVVSLF